MKLIPLTVALIGATEAVHLDLQANVHKSHGSSNQDESDTHLAQLVTQALAGAPPGEITEPVVAVGTDKENDT